MTRVLTSLLLAALLWPATVVVAAPAAAQAGCYSDQQIRGAVQQGQAVPLSNLIGQIQARFGGQVVSSRLCSNGGRLAYFVTLLVGGQVREIRIDAISGVIQ